MSGESIGSFEEFWPHYVRAHSKKGNRLLHFAGLTAAMGCVAGAIALRRPKLALVAPLIGYGAAWIGHFGIEGNVPASFGHPIWSLASDFVMWAKIATGTMDAEVERATAAAVPANDVEPARQPVESSAPADRYAVN